jgi:hypothetical protein
MVKAGTYKLFKEISADLEEFLAIYDTKHRRR